ncbi:MAG: hypothetical protein ACOZIN_16105 [Myxococcota bacterium]
MSHAALPLIRSGCRRDFIIGSVHVLKVSGAALEEPVHAVPSPPPLSLAQTRCLGAQCVASSLAGTHALGAPLYDLSRLLPALRKELERSHTGNQLALIVCGALDALEMDDRAQVALGLLHDLKEATLARMGRAGLVALLEACLAAEAEQREEGLRRVKAELARRGAFARLEAGVVLVAEGVSSEAVKEASRRLAKMTAEPKLRAALEGMTVLVVSQEERWAEQAISLEHLSRCGAALPLPVSVETVMVLHEERLLTRSELSWRRAWGLVRGLFTRPLTLARAHA